MLTIDNDMIVVTQYDTANIECNIKTIDGVPYDPLADDVITYTMQKDQQDIYTTIATNGYILIPTNCPCGTYAYYITLDTEGQRYTVKQGYIQVIEGDNNNE